MAGVKNEKAGQWRQRWGSGYGSAWGGRLMAGPAPRSAHDGQRFAVFKGRLHGFHHLQRRQRVFQAGKFFFQLAGADPISMVTGILCPACDFDNKTAILMKTLTERQMAIVAAKMRAASDFPKLSGLILRPDRCKGRRQRLIQQRNSHEEK